MNIMDRDYILKLSNCSKKSMQDIYNVLNSYCLEHGKSQDKIDAFISASIKNGEYYIYFTEALEYYRRKFNICQLIDNNKVIMYC